MLIVYDRIDALCKEKGKNITIMCKEIPISRSILSEYKAGRTKTIKADVLSKIAEYLGTTTDYILGNTDDPTLPQKEKPATGEGDGQILSDSDKAIVDRIMRLDNEGKRDAMKYLDYLLNQDRK